MICRYDVSLYVSVYLLQNENSVFKAEAAGYCLLFPTCIGHRSLVGHACVGSHHALLLLQ